MAILEALISYYREYIKVEDKADWCARNPVKADMVIKAMLARAHAEND